MTTAGSRACRFGSASRLNAPVSCSAIRKSLAFLIPRIRLFFMSMIVGRPAPVAIATWSKPYSHASSIGIVPPNRMPPYIRRPLRRASVRCSSVRKFLSQRTVMPYSDTPPNPSSTRSSSVAVDLAPVADRPRRLRVGADDVLRQRLDLQAVDADDAEAFVHEVMRQRVPGRAEPDDEHVLAVVRQGVRPADVQRIPARQQPVDLDAPRHLQHVGQHAGLDLRNVDRLLLLVDARLHAVVADPVAGARAHRVVDDRRAPARRPRRPPSGACASRKSSRRADSRRARCRAG